ACLVREVAERCHEIVFDDDRVRTARLQRGRRLRSAERADERLFGWTPIRLSAACRAMEFFARRCCAVPIRRGICLLIDLSQCLSADVPGFGQTGGRSTVSRPPRAALA